RGTSRRDRQSLSGSTARRTPPRGKDRSSGGDLATDRGSGAVALRRRAEAAHRFPLADCLPLAPLRKRLANALSLADGCGHHRFAERWPRCCNVGIERARGVSKYHFSPTARTYLPRLRFGLVWRPIQ